MARRVGKAFVHLRKAITEKDPTTLASINKIIATSDYDGLVLVKFADPKQNIRVLERKVGTWEIQLAASAAKAPFDLRLTLETIAEVTKLPVYGEP